MFKLKQTGLSQVCLLLTIAFFSLKNIHASIQPVTPVMPLEPTPGDSFEKIEKLAGALVADTSTLRADGTLVIFTRSQYYPLNANTSWSEQLKAAAAIMDLPIKKGRTYSVEGEMAAIDLVFASVAQSKDAHPILRSFMTAFHRDMVSRLPVFERIQYTSGSHSKMVTSTFETLYREEKKVLEEWKRLEKLRSQNSSILNSGLNAGVNAEDLQKLYSQLPSETPRTPYGMPMSYQNWISSALVFLPQDPATEKQENPEGLTESEEDLSPETSIE